MNANFTFGASRRRPPLLYDLPVLAELPDLFPKLGQFLLLGGRERARRSLAAIDLGLLHPVPDRRLGEVQLPRHLPGRLAGREDLPDDLGLELVGEATPLPGPMSDTVSALRSVSTKPDQAQADVIELRHPKKDPPLFVALRHETARHLSDAANALLDDAVNLACSGPWAARSDEQKVGAVANISTEALMECGDERVSALARLYIETRSVITLLRTKPGYSAGVLRRGRASGSCVAASSRPVPGGSWSALLVVRHGF